MRSRPSSSALLLIGALAFVSGNARADEGVLDIATPGPELSFSIAAHALLGAAVVTLATEFVVSNSVDSVTPLGGYSGLTPTALTLLTAATSMTLPLLSGSVLYLLERNNRLWRVQPGLIFAAGVIPEVAAQTYYAIALHNFTVQGGLTAPNLLPKLIGAQIAAAIVVPVVQVVATHLLREPDPDR